MVFFARHKKREGQLLKPGEPGYGKLRQEWLDIRNLVVRPSLAEKASGMDPTQLPDPPLEPGKHLNPAAIRNLCAQLRGYYATQLPTKRDATYGYAEYWISGILATADCIRRIQSLQNASVGQERR
jgi:hypothetical protein